MRRLEHSENPKIGSFDYYQRLHDIEELHWWSRGMRAIAGAILARHYDGTSGLDILDAGCGTGITLSWLQPYSLPKPVTGIDISDHALQFCRSRGDFLLGQASVLNLPFKAESFDLVVCNDVIQHLPATLDQESIREFFRVLRPAGCLLLRTNSRKGLSERTHPADADFRLYELEEVEKQVRLAGFQILKATYANTVLSLIPALKRYLRLRKKSQYRYDGLAIRRLPAHLRWLSAMLFWVVKAEAWVLSQPGRKASFGHSIFVFARKPV